ncbi:indole-3-acetaldehyde oxidase isoform X2 [Manihot esculenta]|uniref:indole-3-acetaldehyde oxidase isoform X2 n=1 Tax=Manihot esculenta TaxID=3983 RepID=UPI000B5D7959|nr:indole-3-acetaldehyde oxidase isoform X2 [Manihot esculenta]
MEEDIQFGKKSYLVFAVNGQRFELSTVDPTMTLLEFLRTQTPFKSVKLGCGEGGCGACTVLLSKYDPLLDQVEDFTASSCLTLLCSINGCSITTTEGLGNSKVGFHSIHKRFSGFHASQCGFCTPGMCMSLFGALVNAEKTDRPEPSPRFSKMTVVEAEKAIAGNLCRCTGYRPIADACKSFAFNVDIEDLGFNSFWKKGERQEVNISGIPLYNHEICTFPAFLKREITPPFMLINSKRCSWHQPSSFEELQSLLKCCDADNLVRMKLVVGNTSMGYHRELEHYDRYIDLRYIPELSMIRRDHTGIEIGAAVTISKAIEALREENKAEFISAAASKLAFEKIADHMEKIAAKFIRNIGSIGGNLVMAQGKHFPSDIATVLLAASSFVHIITGSLHEKLSLEEFLERPPLDSKSVLVSVRIPNCRSIEDVYPERDSKLLFETYRAAPRPLGNALPFMNAAFLAEVSYSKSSSGSMLNSCKLAFGAFGTKHAIRAREVEEFLTGKLLTTVVLYEAIKLVKAIVVPADGTLHPAYRSSLAVGFLFDFLGQLVESNSNGRLNGYSSNSIFEDVKLKEKSDNLDHVKYPALLSSSKQVIPLNQEYHPIGRPITKSGSALQASDTQKHADIAAKLAVVDYDLENLEPPILTVEEAVKRSSLFEIPPVLYPKQVGDFSKGMAEADHRVHSAEIKLGSQYYFYMENQTALAVPDEDNCMVVYSSIQCPEHAQVAIAKCLGVPEHNVRVLTRRVGGGFGGKVMKSMLVATACALAAHKCQRPVRIYMDRKTDMIMVGGRHPMKITYSVGFKSNGKITALHLDILVNAGISLDISPLMPNAILTSLKKYDWGALSFDIKLCKTNLSSKSAMRAPGDLQGSYIAEAVIEQVASFLSMDPDSLRAINFHTYNSLKLFYDVSAGDPLEYTLITIWDKLATSSSFNQRTKMIKEFNRYNMWKKRGISRIPCVYAVSLRPTPGKVSILRDGSIVVEVGGIELGQGLWTKVKQMAAFTLSSIKCDGDADFLDKVRVIQADTLSLIQGGITGGSTTSESSCEAIRLCCEVLVERLMPLKKRLLMQTDSIRWEMLIQKAYLEAVNLSVNSYFVPDFASECYLNYGAAVSEVEVDLLTGQTTILRSDILYDCGQSLNPAVDLGQIEGAFVQGIGFFMLEEYTTNSDGLVDIEGTWTYKIPTIDTIPKQFNVELLSSGYNSKRVLSSKASGEPPLLLAASVHCATRAAIREARKQLHSWGGLDSSYSTFELGVPATMPIVKELCGLDGVERYLLCKVGSN